MRWNIFSCILHGGENWQISCVVVAVAMINAWPTDVNPNFCWKELKHLHTNQSYHCWPFLLSTAAKLRQPVGGKQQTLINPKGDLSPYNALWQSFNGRCDIQNFELCLSFYPRPNISDWFPSHYIRIQIFQTNFSVILYL